MVVCAADDIDGLLGTAGAKLDGNREELSASGLSNDVTTLNTGKVDKAGLDETLLALGGPNDLVGESTNVSPEYTYKCLLFLPVTGVGHGESSGTSTVLSLDDLVTTELDTCLLSAT